MKLVLLLAVGGGAYLLYKHARETETGRKTVAALELGDYLANKVQASSGPPKVLSRAERIARGGLTAGIAAGLTAGGLGFAAPLSGDAAGVALSGGEYAGKKAYAGGKAVIKKLKFW